MRGPDRAATRDRGAALAVAIFALAIIGALVAGSFPGGLLEQQSGRNTLFISQAAHAAEAELENALVTVPAGQLRALVVGGAPLDLGRSVPSAGSVVDRRVSRLTDILFLMESRATRVDANGSPLAVRKLGLLTMLAPDSSADSVLRVRQRAWLQLY
jgi:hypothetical protein